MFLSFHGTDGQKTQGVKAAGVDARGHIAVVLSYGRRMLNNLIDRLIEGIATPDSVVSSNPNLLTSDESGKKSHGFFNVDGRMGN